MRITNLIKSISFIFFLFSTLLFSAEVGSVDQFLSRYEQDIRQIRNESQIESFSESALKGVGISSPLRSFMELLYTTEHYAPQIEYLSRNVTNIVNRGVLTGVGRTRILTAYREFHTLNQYTRASKTMSDFFRYAVYYQIGYDAYQAYIDKSPLSRLKAIKSAYNFAASTILANIGFGWVGILTSVIDLSLTYFIETTFDEYHNLVYAAYEDYILTRYGTLQPWVDLYLAEDKATFNARLNEFWDNALVNLNDYLDRHPEASRNPYVREGTALAFSQKDKYAARYVKERIAVPLRNRAKQLTERELLVQKSEMEEYLKSINKIIEDARWLKKQLDNITIIEPEQVEHTSADIQEIFISPGNATIKQGSSVDFSVTAILKGEEETLMNITALAPIFPEVNNIRDELGEHTLSAEYLGKEATATLKVITDPILSIMPSYKEIDINQSDRRVIFTVSFSDEIGVITDVTDDAFSIYGTNEFEFENVGEQNIGINFTYQGTVYYAEAIINVVGCSNPEQVQNTNGECVCDKSRGYFATNDPDICSKYEIVKFEPDRIESFVGDVVILDAVGIDKNGNKTILESVKFEVKLKGDNTYNHYVEERMITAIISGVECDGTTNEEWNVAQGTCDCMDGFTRNNDGVCVPIEEVDEETEYDCSTENIESLMELVAILIGDYKHWETELLGYINQFNKEINDQSSNPCNNNIIAFCYSNAIRIATELDGSKNDIIDTVAEILMFSTVCNDRDNLLSGSSIPVTNLISSVNSLDSYQEPLNQMKSRLLENGCDEQEVADTGEKTVPPEEDPGFVQDGGTFTTGSSGNLPDGGVGTDNDIFNQCMNAKGINVNNIENEITKLNIAYQKAASAYYDDDNDDPYKCHKYKYALNDYLEFYVTIRDCIIEAGLSDNLEYIQLLIDSFMAERNQLPC